MYIRKKRIRYVGSYIRGVNRGEKIVVSIGNLSRFTTSLIKAGFSKELGIGETVLPTAIGPISTFNSEGKDEIHNDQPKETAYRQAEWKWKEFCGRYDRRERSKIVEIPYERYPRTFIQPPSVELTIVQNKEGDKILRSPTHEYIESNDEKLLHIINLFLEYFGECELLKENLMPVIPAHLIRLNWEILPQGCMPWIKLKHLLSPIIESQPEGNKVVVNKRFETINSFEPEFVAFGHSGFHGYVIFGFPAKQLYILESTQINNATYVIERDWEVLSTMTKAELLNKNLHKERIIHRKNWFNQITRLLKI